MVTAKSDKILPGMTKEEIATSPLPLSDREAFDEEEEAAFARCWSDLNGSSGHFLHNGIRNIS